MTTPKDSKDTPLELSLKEEGWSKEGKPGDVIEGPPALATIDKYINSGLGDPVISKAEAKKAGLKFYWPGEPCSKGHHAKRRTVNGICVACMYLSNAEREQRKKADRQAYKNPSRVLQEEKKRVQVPLDVKEKVLAVYAETGSLELAGKAVNLTLAELNVIIARTPNFATQVYALEKRMKALKEKEESSYTPSKMVWSEEKYDLFIKAYVDTGNIAAARDAVGASASSYFDELDANPDFAERVKQAHPKAAQALEEKAIQLALEGNDKLLGVVLKAKLPEYKDKLQIDSSNTTYIKLPDNQINERIGLLLNKYSSVIEGEVLGPRLIANDPEGPGAASSLSGRAGTKKDKEPAGVLLPGNRTAQ